MGARVSIMAQYLRRFLAGVNGDLSPSPQREEGGA